MKNALKLFIFILILFSSTFISSYILSRFFYPIENQLQDAGIVFIQDIELETAENIQKEKESLLQSWLDKIGGNDDLEVVSLSDVFPYQVYNERLAELKTNIDKGLVSVVKKNTTKIYKESDILSDALVISNDGWVVLGMDVYKQGVEFLSQDGKILEVEFFVDDISTGMRFVKLKADNLSVLKFSNDNFLMNGEFVIGIDSLENTYVGNIIDKYYYGFDRLDTDFLNKKILLDFHAEELMMTSPVFNFNGEVVAVISSNIDGQITATPIGYLTLHLADIYNDNLLGYNFNIIYKDLAHSLLPVAGYSKGALVESSSLSNLLIGDIIVKIDEQELNKLNSLNELLHQYKVGATVEFVIIRNGQEIIEEIIL